jgi:predicted NUDIX family phosphoesterase
MIKDTDYITVVHSNFLFDSDNKKFTGFVPADSSHPNYKADFENIILNHSESMMHESAFKDDNYREIIACFFIVNPDTRLISAYRNAPSDKKGVDPALGIWSCGYKGHVKSLDTDILDTAINESSIIDPILSTRYKDLSNGIQLMNGTIDINRAKLLGYINNDHNKLSQTNFTLVYGLCTDSTEIINPGANYNKNISLSELDNLIKLSKTDYWTRESFPALCIYLNNFESDSFE